MKKTFALLAALMLVVMMLPTSAMAYEAVKPGTADADGNYYTTNVKHTLELTDLMNKLEEGVSITYSFEVAPSAVIKIPENGFKDPTMAVSGAPSINDIVYNDETDFGTSAKKDQPLEINWKNVSIKEPGLYTWKVTKKLEMKGTTDTASNSEEENGFYVWALAKINGGKLEITNTGISRDGTTEQGDNNSNKGNLEDQYPEKKVNLGIGKTVSGAMASTEQYFLFSVSLKSLISDVPYTITYTENGSTLSSNDVPATAYNDSTSNPASVTISTTPTVVTMWLKHNQTATINGLPYGTSYTIVEGNAENPYNDFEVTATINEDGDTPDTMAVDEKHTVSDAYLTRDTTVTYQNKKDPTVPTGITLHTAAPVMGLLLAMSLLAILYLGKRKEAAA